MSGERACPEVGSFLIGGGGGGGVQDGIGGSMSLRSFTWWFRGVVVKGKSPI